jgi:hypothetical protein
LPMMRLSTGLIVATLAALAGVTALSASSANSRTVPCGQSIASTRFPYFGSNRPENRYRQVLGVVAVPPAFMRQVVPTRQMPWAYWRKQGLVVSASGKAVNVTVPKSWRRRAAITWGNGIRPVSSLRIEGCHTSAGIGYAYAGGFLLRSPSACVPLVFSVGSRRATVRFGVGQRCHP